MACNIAVRHELGQVHQLPAEYVNHLMRWANGLKGKLDKLLQPLPERLISDTTMRNLSTKADMINRKRNEVVHAGHFMNEAEAKEVVNAAKEFVQQVVEPYKPGFHLEVAEA